MSTRPTYGHKDTKSWWKPSQDQADIEPSVDMGKLLGEAFGTQTKRHLSFRARVRELSTGQRNRVSTHWPQPPESWKAGFLFLLEIEAGRGVGDGVGDGVGLCDDVYRMFMVIVGVVWW